MKEIILHPISTEKAIRMIEAENKLAFIVGKDSNKMEIKKAIEKMFDVKVDEVKTMLTTGGEKKAYIKLNPKSRALDIATKLRII